MTIPSVHAATFAPQAHRLQAGVAGGTAGGKAGPMAPNVGRSEAGRPIIAASISAAIAAGFAAGTRVQPQGSSCRPAVQGPPFSTIFSTRSLMSVLLSFIAAATRVRFGSISVRWSRLRRRLLALPPAGRAVKLAGQVARTGLVSELDLCHDSRSSW